MCRSLRKTQDYTPAVIVVAVLSCSLALSAQSNVDAVNKYAWGENIGWTNWRDAAAGGSGVEVTATYLSGFIWAENVGWINVGDGSPANGVDYGNVFGSDSGVNIDSDGDLYGLAWGENVGWINFDTSSLGADQASFDACKHTFFGYAWGENVGWINLNAGGASKFVALGPCGFGDYDCDADVGSDDFVAFISFFGGPAVSVDCDTFDSDSDGDIDLADFAAFQAAYTGP